VGNILEKGIKKKYNYVYLELSSANSLLNAIKLYDPCAIIFNYLNATMPWLSRDIINNLKQSVIKLFCIVHNSYFSGFDYYLHQDPFYVPVDDHNYSLPRPLFEYTPNSVKKSAGVLRIGSFGFAGNYKKLPELCELIYKEFGLKKSVVEINLHITKAFFGSDNVEDIKKTCYDVIQQNVGIKINFTHNFMTNIELLDFLHSNDLNMFFYDNYAEYNGISSCIDYALSVKKPIAVCKSNMFSHILNTTPSICVEDLSIEEIVSNGFSPLESRYNQWSHEKFVDHVDNILSKICTVDSDYISNSISCSVRKLGVFFTMFNEKDAVEYSIGQLKKVYPDIPVYVVSEGIDMSDLQDRYNNLKFLLGEDTMGFTFKITSDNWRESINQLQEKRCALEVICRLKKAISFCKSEYILMMDPDALVRGELTIPDNVKLLGSRVNSGLPQEYKDVLATVPGAVIIDTWGATPAIFHVPTFLKAVDFLESHMDVFDRLCMSFYAIYAHDVLLPTIFALVGEEETSNPDIIECMREPDWEMRTNPLVHQFKRYYPRR